MSSRKEGRRLIDKAVAAAHAAGWTVKQNGSHWQFVPSDPSQPIVRMSDSGSDTRALANNRRALKRAGLELE